MSDPAQSEDSPEDDGKRLKLQVANARPEDSGRGLARLSRENLAKLGLIEGDVVEILGKQATPARAVLPYPEDEGLDFVRLDGLQRANSGTGAGDFVEIRKVESRPAKKVVFAPAQKDLRLQGNGGGLKRSFMAAAIAPDAGGSRIFAHPDPTQRGVDRAQGHCSYRRRDRGRAAAGI